MFNKNPPSAAAIFMAALRPSIDGGDDVVISDVIRPKASVG